MTAFLGKFNIKEIKKLQTTVHHLLPRELSEAEVKECILKGGDDVEALKDKVVTGKRLNAYNSLQLAEEMAQKHRVQNN